MTAFLRPGALDEALEMRASHPDYVVVAGGTDLMVVAHGKPEPKGMIDLFGLGPLVGVRGEAGAVRIGAGTTYREILESALVKESLPMLHAAAREIGALQIQARGTIGGNVATSSPVGDTLPVLLALDAEILLTSRRGERALPYADFITGYRKTALAADELILALRVPIPAKGRVQHWRKVGTRRAQAISKVMLAAVGGLDASGRIDHVRLAFGAVRDRTVRAKETEGVVLGARPTEIDPASVRAAVQRDISPIDDVRSSAHYRRVVAQNLALRFVLGL